MAALASAKIWRMESGNGAASAAAKESIKRSEYGSDSVMWRENGEIISLQPANQ